MGYRVLYDNQLLFDPYTRDRITDTKLSGKLNAASYFDFTIAPTHSLYSKLAERAGEVRIYFNDLILFKGEITQIEEDFEGNRSVSCTGALDYLTATRVRPYSTVEGEQPLKAPSSFDGYFQWLIDQHNSNCLDSRKYFSVGVNQGNMLDKNNYIYRASEQRPTTASEIEDKILNSAGGYLFVRYQNDLNILDLYADVHDINTQIIDYGVNMLDFTKTTTAEGQYTAVVATGYTPDPPEGQTDVKMKPITLEGCKDGGTPYSSTIVKMGDRVYDVDAVNRYGYHEYYVSNTDITTYDGLLYYACKTLNTLLSPALTISVRAVDLALIMGEKYKHLQLGQAVRVRSKPRKVDEYLMVNSIDLDLLNPDNTTFDLGASYDTLTGQQSAYLKSLNSSINASLDTVSALGDNVKNSAKLAQEAKDTADSASSAASKAQQTATTASSNASTALSTANTAKKTADSASSTATTASSNASSALTKANSAASDASTAKSDAASAKSTANTANSTANTAKKTADTANSTANTVKNDLANLSIGGRNLVLNTGDNFKFTEAFHQSSSTWVPDGYFEYARYNIPETDPFYDTKVGDQIAISFDLEMFVPENTSFFLQIYDSNIAPNISFGVFQPENAKDFPKGKLSTLRMYATTTLKSTTSTHTTRGIEFYCEYGSGRYFKIHRIKIERGNKPTDWSPAPEDYSTTTEMQSSIEQTAESIKSTVAATYVNNQTLSSYATKSQLDQTATSLTSRIQTTETTVNGMNTTVKQVNNYMTFASEGSEPTLTIGSSSSSFRTKLTNTSEKFMQGDQTIMELDGVTSTVKTSRVQMGHYQWRDTGASIQLVYIP